MAVLERSYKRFEGTLTPEWSRFLIIPRHAVRDVFRSKVFTAFFALSFIWPLVCAILIYLHYNVDALAVSRLNVRNLLPIDAIFFQEWVIAPQAYFGFFLAMLVGPQQVSRDLTNNALPLYLCRPLTRGEYVVGKMSLIIILVSTVTWVPGLLLFLLQSYLEGWSWFADNIWIASAIFISSLVLILLLALTSQAISAWVKWLVAARAALLAAFFIPTAFDLRPLPVAVVAQGQGVRGREVTSGTRASCPHAEAQPRLNQITRLTERHSLSARQAAEPQLR